jgi:hypothetical protein
VGYNEDLLPLADQIEIVFKLELSPDLEVLVTKYGQSILSAKNSKKEFSKTIKTALKRILSNLSRNYTEGLLEKYFSHDGLALFISNILIDLSKKHINEELTKLNH